MLRMKHPLRGVVLAFAVLGAISACQRQPQQEAPHVDTAKQDADFGVRLALLEGHLMVGRELLEAGQTENALPHFGHPVRELYSDMLPVIAARGGQQFDRDLVALESLAAQGSTPAFAPAYDAAMAEVRAARGLIAADRLNSDAFTLQLIADVATAAAQEYRNAIVAGRVGSLVEYHDARGFVFYMTDLLAAHRGEDARLMQVAALAAELKTYVEPLNPPSPIRATDAQFEAKAAAIRAIAAGPAPGAP
jgi:hypothetical protein